MKKELNFFQSFVLLLFLLAIIPLTTVSLTDAWGSEQWHDSRQFENYLQEKIPNEMKKISWKNQIYAIR